MKTTTNYYNGELAESFLGVYNLMGIRYVLIALIDPFVLMFVIIIVIVIVIVVVTSLFLTLSLL